MKIKHTIFQPSLLFAVALLGSAAGYAVNPIAYIGGKFGGGTTDSRITTSATNPALGNQDRTDLSGRGVDGGILLGAGCFFGMNDCFFLGGELSGSLSNISGSSSRAVNAVPNVSEFCLKKKNDLVALFKAGFLVREVAMPFFLIGVSTAQFELKTTILPDSKTNKNRHTGLVLGLGIDFSVTPCLVIGIQGTHKRYNSKSHTLNLTGAPLSVTHQVKPRSNEFHVTAKWKFYQRNS